MSYWSTLIKTAFLGTQRASLPPLPTETVAATLLTQLHESSPEHTLLTIAGTLDLYEQIGHLPPHYQSSPPPKSPTPSRPICSETASQHLATMLNGRFAELLPQFLTTLTQTAQRLPPQHLPQLLERASKKDKLRPFLLAALDPQARWLAQQNPDWTYASHMVESWADLRHLWPTLTLLKQAALLRQLRPTQPNWARHLIESSWKQAPATTKTRYLAPLEINLSMADEPFLETALDDRSHTIRRKTAELLAMLPTSRFCHRAIKHTQKIVTWSGQTETPLHIAFPVRIPPAMLRDGVPNHQAGKDLSRTRANQLRHLIGAVPLNHWTTQWQASPTQIIAAAAASKWPRTLMLAFATATQRQQAVEWIRPLLIQDNYSIATTKLTSLLPDSTFDMLVKEIDKATSAQLLNKDHPLIRMLRPRNQQWSTQTTDIWLNHLITHIQQDEQTRKRDHVVHNLARRFALHDCPPNRFQTTLTSLIPLRREGSIWNPSLNAVITSLRFRQRMLAALKADDEIKQGIASSA